MTQEELARRKILSLVKNKTANLRCYSDGNLWYETEDGFRFPVPIEDAKGGVFNHEERAIRLMRWIRLQKAAITAGGTLVEE